MAPQLMGTKGPVTPRAAAMDGPRHELLAGAALALDQGGGVGLGHALHDGEDVADGPGRAQDLLEVVRLLLGAGGGLGLLGEGVEEGGAAEDDLELVEGDRLQVVIEGAELDRAERVLAVGVAGHHDDLDWGAAPRISSSALSPSSAVSGLGGSPRSRLTSTGWASRSWARASARFSAKESTY